MVAKQIIFSQTLSGVVIATIKNMPIKNGLNWVHMDEAIKERSRPVIQFTPDGKLVAEYSSTMEASRITNYTQSRIATYCRGENKRFLTYKGYIWRYKNE